MSTASNNLSYAAHGGMSGATLGNGAVEGVLYNDRLQPKTVSLTKDNTILQKYEYKYGQVDQSTGAVDETKNNGQIARIEGYIGTAMQWQQRYSYDSIGRLATSGEHRGDTLAQTHQSNFSYDRFGNRYQKQAQNSQSLPFTPVEDADINSATNRLTTNTTYDNAGNVTVDNKFRGRQYRYDANGRMCWSANVDNTGKEFGETRWIPGLCYGDSPIAEVEQPRNPRDSGPQDTIPTDLKQRVQDIAKNCEEFLNRFLAALGAKKVDASNIADLLDRLPPPKLSEKDFPKNLRSAGMIKGSQIYVYSDATTARTASTPRGQEHRWNAIAITVFGELLHRAGGHFDDKAIDKAARTLMDTKEQDDAEKKMKDKNYQPGTVGYKFIKDYCKPPERK